MQFLFAPSAYFHEAVALTNSLVMFKMSGNRLHITQRMTCAMVTAVPNRRLTVILAFSKQQQRFFHATLPLGMIQVLLCSCQGYRILQMPASSIIGSNHHRYTLCGIRHSELFDFFGKCGNITAPALNLTFG